MFSVNNALAVLLAALPLSQALTQLDLRQRSVYQVLTDRFERGDGQNTYCDVSRREYCGGTWRGITSRLDYIQEMGFDTGVSRWCWEGTDEECGYRPLWPISKERQ